MSTSVHLARTIVTNMPHVITLWAATHASAIQDTTEMELIHVLQVCELNLMTATWFFVLKQPLITSFIVWFGILRATIIQLLFISSIVIKQAALAIASISVLSSSATLLCASDRGFWSQINVSIRNNMTSWIRSQSASALFYPSVTMFSLYMSTASLAFAWSLSYDQS